MLARQELEVVGGESPWLFRQGDLVLGPITGHQLVEKLYTGELTADTLVAPPGARDFVRVGDVAAFKVHVARSVAKARVDADLRVERQRTQRKRMIVGGVAAALTLGLGIGAWQLARYAAVHGPGGELDEFADISVELPTIAMAQARISDEELIDYPTSPGKTPDKPATKPATATPGTTAPTTPASAVAARTPDKKPKAGVSTDPDGLDMGVEFDQSAINKVVASNQRTLFPCLKAEAERRPGFAAKVPIEFVIGNDGRVSKLWVDHPQLKNGELHKCLFEELKKWPFKPYKGSLASVGLSFTVGKKG
ncbi:AgmX/PglI C-terminal domain-containing protein [Hyalangium rubrum]|uniref:AgmX/PglI C-terminal domain-containing protein n=1 Tax=Hyalangium rubrum TaxID=3103134 RepID=A0ABU5H393_9BACT|nr:AgmX/PglI C-terminal domain-containing protein [Hyalangium sp. s54d21]MDY7227942.1 AgmX/PglI C-terminal domain-containing protein [Hyalangium sp. s54d21]